MDIWLYRVCYQNLPSLKDSAWFRSRTSPDSTQTLHIHPVFLGLCLVLDCPSLLGSVPRFRVMIVSVFLGMCLVLDCPRLLGSVPRFRVMIVSVFLSLCLVLDCSRLLYDTGEAIEELIDFTILPLSKEMSLAKLRSFWKLIVLGKSETLFDGITGLFENSFS